MKHLHQQFILASLALGLGAAFILGAVWNIQAISATAMPDRTFVSAMLTSLVGIILLVFGYDGVRCEILGKK